jgi:hypothetical protein
MTEVTNPSPVPSAEQNVPAVGSTENAASAASLKDVVKSATGREYATDEDALKGIQETYKAVTARHEPAPMQTQPQVQDAAMTAVNDLRQQLKVSDFYANHPEYKDVKGIISKFGNDPEQVITDPEFVKTFNALKMASESQNKSTLSSNARIASPKPDDYAQDLERLRKDPSFTAEFMAKHKNIPMLAE